MKNRKEKPTKLRIFAALGSSLLIGAVVYTVISGFTFFAGAAMTVAVLSLGGPVALAGESLSAVIAGCFEAFIDGVLEVVTGIFDAIFSLLN